MKENKTERAILVDCTECGAKAGAPCVFTPLKNPPIEAQSAARRARIAATGTPTSRPHNARMLAAPMPRKPRAERFVYALHNVDLEMCDVFWLSGMMWRLLTPEALARYPESKPCPGCLEDFDALGTQEVLVIRNTK